MESKHRKDSMPAYLLAAGLGTRLAPITDSIPKCLVPIKGKPLLGIWLDLLAPAGMRPIFVNAHHHREKVREFLDGGARRNEIRLIEERELEGTGGALLAQRGTLGKGSFFVAHADNLSRFSPADFVEAHRSRPKNCVVTMMLFRTPTPRSCGIVELDAEGIVTGFHEKVENPPGDLANGAVYVMEPEALDILERAGGDKPDISRNLLPNCLGRINTWLNDGYHRDIGTPESYLLAQKEWM